MHEHRRGGATDIGGVSAGCNIQTEGVIVRSLIDDLYLHTMLRCAHEQKAQLIAIGII